MAAMLAAFVAFATPAAAQTNWTGCYVAAGAGGTIANTELSIGGGSIDGLGSQGLAARAGAECKWHLPKTAFVLGVGGDYTWQNPEFRLGPFTAGGDDSWTAFGTLGIAHGNALAYVLAGYTQTEWSANWTGLPTDTLKGWTFGGGIDLKLNDQVSLGGEYRFTQYDTQSIGPVNLDTDQHTVMVTLKYGLGGLFK